MDTAITCPQPELAMAIAANRDRIYRHLLSMARDPEVTDDLTQETMLRALRAASTLREPAALLPWLYRLATNLFLDKVRATRRRPLGYYGSDRDPGADPVDEIADAGPRADRLAEQTEMSACVREYVDQLPDLYRAVVLLHDEHGLSDREVADTLGLSLAAAKMRLHRARTKLRAALQAGCTVETDDRGVIVCEPASDRPACGPNCTWCSPPSG